MAVEDVVMALLQNRATINESGQELPAPPATMEELYAPKGQPVVDPWYHPVVAPDQVTMLPPMFGMGMV